MPTPAETTSSLAENVTRGVIATRCPVLRRKLVSTPPLLGARPCWVRNNATNASVGIETSGNGILPFRTLDGDQVDTIMYERYLGRKSMPMETYGFRMT